jgi:hypothetical protein
MKGLSVGERGSANHSAYILETLLCSGHSTRLDKTLRNKTGAHVNMCMSDTTSQCVAALNKSLVI